MFFVLPHLVGLKRQGSILKSADSLVGEELSFAVFVPSKEPYFFKCMNIEQKSMWMGVLNKYAASTEWSTSSMVREREKNKKEKRADDLQRSLRLSILSSLRARKESSLR